MKCPVCTNDLASVNAGGVTVDVCVNGCGGIWFDQFELKELDEPRETAGDLLNQVTSEKVGLPTNDERRNCPRCPDIVMMRHFFSPKRRVVVDECPQCGGFWLDAGELALIR